MPSSSAPRRGRLVLGYALIVCLAGGNCVRLRAQAPPVCGPTPDIKAALERLPSDQAVNQTEWQFHQLRESAIETLLRQYPDDFFVQQAYVRFMVDSAPSERDKVFAEYKALHEQRPEDARLAYLYGLLLLDRDSPQATKLFKSALEKAADFPWPHLQLVSIYSSPNFLDKDQAVLHMKTFLEACPGTLEAYEPLTRMDDRELITRSAAQLRQILQARSDPEALGAYPTLWSLEFKARPPAEYGTLRKQVVADLERIRALNLQGERRWWSALEEGYKLANDQKQADWAEDESARRFPSPWNLPAMTRWNKDHQFPGADAPVDKRRAYYRELLSQTNDWVKQRPNSTMIWNQRFRTMENLDDVPAADFEACLDKMLQVAEANAGPNPVDSYVYYGVTVALSEKKLQPERQIAMARKWLDAVEEEAKRPPEDLYFSKKEVDDQKFYSLTQRADELFYEIDAHLRLKQADKAQAKLTQLDDRLQDLKSQAGDRDDRRKSLAGSESSYWGAMARLAQLKDRKLDAMAYYESVLLARLDSGQLPPSGEKDELAEGARQLWTSLGGTDEGWKTWYGRKADALALASKRQLFWETANEPLPQFQLTDLKGKTWQIADLKGKVTFLNFWASW